MKSPRQTEVRKLCEEAMAHIEKAWNIYDRLRADDGFGAWCCMSETGDDSDLLQDALDLFGGILSHANSDQAYRGWLEENGKSEEKEDVAGIRND